MIGLVIRLKISESPIFEAAVERDAAKDKPWDIPLLSVVKRPKNLLLVMFGGAAGFALQTLLATFTVAYAVAHGAERQPVLYAFACASVLSIGMVILAGKISDRVGRRPLMLLGMVAFIAFVYPLFALMRTADTFLIFVGFAVALLCHSTIYGPLAAFISEQFGTAARYTGASVGCQMATLLGAGFTPTILAAIYGGDGRIGAVVTYLIALTCISGLAILLTKESKDIDLTTYEH